MMGSEVMDSRANVVVATVVGLLLMVERRRRGEKDFWNSDAC
jgi:hypothetical protein